MEKKHVVTIDRLREKRIRLIKIVSSLLLLSVILAFIFLVAPTNLLLVAVFIVLVASFTFVSSTLVISQKYSILAGVSVFLFLAINLLVGFQIVNNLLLLSGIIGIVILLKKQ